MFSASEEWMSQFTFHGPMHCIYLMAMLGVRKVGDLTMGCMSEA